MPSRAHRSPDLLVEEQLVENVKGLERVLNAHVLTWYGPIQSPADVWIRQAIEHRRNQDRRSRLAVVLQTPGGYIETAERIANTFRQHYRWVSFLVPDMAMSAGTVLAMSGDEIWMDYFSQLGPIDPQVERTSPDGRRGLVPALGYIKKYQELIDKSNAGTLTPAEAAYFVQNFDPAELYYYQQARNLSIELLKKWLVKYKFKNWKRTRSRKLKVTPTMKRERAEDIGAKLNDTDRWCSHSRGLSMQVLKSDLKLEIEDIESNPDLQEALESYYALLMNYLRTIGANGALHAGSVFMPMTLGGS